MKRTRFLVGFGIALGLVGSSGTAFGLQIKLDSGAGSTTFTDDNLDGIIDFNTTVGGVFVAKGRAFEQVRADATVVSLSSAPPAAETVFANVGTVDATFTITIDSSAFSAIGPPLGWSIFYSGRTSDSLTGPVTVSAHSVQALTHAGALSLATLAGVPSMTPENFALSASGVDGTDSGTDMRVVYTFTLGPNDEIHLPNNDDTDGAAIQVSVFNQQLKCVDKMNTLSRKVLDAAQKSDSACVKTGAKAGGADETVCVDNAADAKTDAAKTKLLDGYNAICVANLPPWGVNGGRCCRGGSSDGNSCVADPGCPGGACLSGACMSSAADLAANEVTHDLFGASVTVTDGDARGRCQMDVIKSAGKLIVQRWKTFRSCKKDNFSAIADDADLVSVCLGPPQPDPKGKIDRGETRLENSISDRCVGKGVTPAGAAFPGVCTGAGDATIAACMIARINCRFCLAVNVADDIDPPVNCDMFDDASVNGSCP